MDWEKPNFLSKGRTELLKFGKWNSYHCIADYEYPKIFKFVKMGG